MWYNHYIVGPIMVLTLATFSAPVLSPRSFVRFSVGPQPIPQRIAA
jgi:hypothetical protein